VIKLIQTELHLTFKNKKKFINYYFLLKKHRKLISQYFKNKDFYIVATLKKQYI